MQRVKSRWLNELLEGRKLYEASSIDDLIFNKDLVNKGRNGIAISCSGTYIIDSIKPTQIKEVYTDILNITPIVEARLSYFNSNLESSIIINPDLYRREFDNDNFSFNVLSPYFFYVRSPTVDDNDGIEYIKKRLVLFDCERIYSRKD